MLADLHVLPILLLLLLLPAALLLVFWVRRYFTRRKVLTDIQLLLQDLVLGRTERRADYGVRGPLGLIARAANELVVRMEAAAREAAQDRRNLQAILQNTDQIVVVTDENGLVQLINPAAQRLINRPPEVAVGLPLDHVLPYPEVLALHHAAYSSARPVTRHVRLPVPRRTLLCLVTAGTMYVGPHFRGTLLIMRDLTDLQQALQIKTDFVTNASHELRTPLATILAAVETLHDCLPADDPASPDLAVARRCTEIITSQVSRLQAMVQDLLDLARTEDPRADIRTESVDLAHACDIVVPLLAPAAAQKKLPIRLELAADARWLQADERLLVLVLKNLLDNAIKFTTTGHVAIRSYLHHAPVMDGAAAPHPGAGAVTSPSLVLEVADTGCGIPPEDQQRVFERFYTVNRSRGGADRGTGLGLAIVKHALTALGAKIDLESQVDRGTIVRAIFPAAALALPAAPPVALPAKAPPAEAVHLN